MLKRLQLIFLLLFILTPRLAFGEVVPGRVIVKFKPGVVKLPRGAAATSISAAPISAASIKALNKKYGAVRIEKIYAAALAIRPDWQQLENDYRIIITATEDAAAAAKAFQNDLNVNKAEPDLRVHVHQITPNDAHYSQQWGLSKINAPLGWLQTTGDASAIIAVLDTGLNFNHEDFVGKVDLADSYNFVPFKSDGVTPYSPTDVMDDFGHGTATAGVIGAVTNNSAGIAGLDWSAKILPIKVLDDQGGGSTSDISAALAYIAAKKSTGTNIVAANMSFGQYNSGVNKYVEEDPDSLKERCAEAFNQGIVLASSAGNDGVDWNSYPAFYSSVIAVAATDQNDKRSIWNASQSSNFGSWVDVSAPGTDIYSTGTPDTDNTGQNSAYFASWDGTSLSTPFVTGLAALIKASNPLLTAAQITNSITSGATSIDALNPGYAGKLGSGRIDVYKSVGALITKILSPRDRAYIRGAVNVTGSAAGWNFSNYRLEALQGSSLITIEASATTVESGSLGTWDTTALNGQFNLRLTNIGHDGTTDEASSTVFVDNTAPISQITSPVNGATVGDTITIIGTADDQYLNYYTLDYGAGTSPASFQVIGNFSASVDGGALGTWETAGLSGLYTLRLTSTDYGGNSSTTSVVLNITAQNPAKEVSPPVSSTTATFVAPNPFDRSATSETNFVYNLAGNFNVSIYLFDLNGSLVWRQSYAAGDNGGKSGSNSPPWNGKNLYGEAVATGVYLYQITADRKVLARGKIIVL